MADGSQGPAGRRIRERLSDSDHPALALLVLWSVALLAVLLVRAAAKGYTFTVDSRFPTDQLQYLASIRDAGEHGLISNRYGDVLGGHVYLQPMFLVSGVAWRMGLSLQVALLIWKPVAVAALFAGFLAYVRRTLPDGWQRRAALLVALFFFTPAAPVIDILGLGGEAARVQINALAQEMFPAGLLWGYLPAAIALGLMPLFLLGVERILEADRESGRRDGPRTVALTALAGALVSWLHPWQGATLLVVVAGLVVWGRLDRRFLRLAVPSVATAVPLAYYAWLSRSDEAWKLGRELAAVGHFPAWIVALGLAPLAVPAIAGLGGRTADARERMLLLWVPAALAVYLLAPSYAPHGVEGVSLPLAVLAVRGWVRVAGRLQATPATGAASWARAAAIAAAVALTLPAAAFAARTFRKALRANPPPSLLSGDEVRALSLIAHDPGRGRVATRWELGTAVPAFTGRVSWLGHPSFTIGFFDRRAAIDAVLDGRTSPEVARETLRDADSAYLISSGCGQADLTAALEPIRMTPHRFGCVTVYVRER